MFNYKKSYCRHTNTCEQRCTYKHTHYSTVYNDQKLRQPNRSLTGNWLNQLWNTPIMESYGLTKKEQMSIYTDMKWSTRYVKGRKQGAEQCE